MKVTNEIPSNMQVSCMLLILHSFTKSNHIYNTLKSFAIHGQLLLSYLLFQCYPCPIVDTLTLSTTKIRPNLSIAMWERCYGSLVLKPPYLVVKASLCFPMHNFFITFRAHDFFIPLVLFRWACQKQFHNCQIFPSSISDHGM